MYAEIGSKLAHLSPSEVRTRESGEPKQKTRKLGRTSAVCKQACREQSLTSSSPSLTAAAPRSCQPPQQPLLSAHDTHYEGRVGAHR